MPVMEDEASPSGEIENDVDVVDVGFGNEVHFFAKPFVSRQRGPYYNDWKRSVEDERTRDATYEYMLSHITKEQKRELFRDHFRRKQQRKQDAVIIGSMVEFDPAIVELQKREVVQHRFCRFLKKKKDVDKTKKDVDKRNDKSNDNGNRNDKSHDDVDVNSAM